MRSRKTTGETTGMRGDRRLRRGQVLSDYLSEIARVRATGAGTGEISYYGALQGALNAVGGRLKPKIFCVQNLANRRRAGHPDFGLFEARRPLRADAPEWPQGVPPERGVVEADDVDSDLSVKLGSRQVADYRAAYGLVLVTNYRDFALVGSNGAGRPEVRERFSFEIDADGFFALAAGARHPPGRAARYEEFLERVLLHQAPLAKPEDVAFFLASYARDALARVEERADRPELAAVRGALEQSLGLTFEPGKGEHLFRSSLVQTLFYGLFSAWVEHVSAGGGRFDWRRAQWSLHVAMVRALFEQVATPSRLGRLGLIEVLDWAAAALDRVDRRAFFARFEEEEAVRYFYEPFLAAFDPVLRKELGVWYTPREIVRYMVERIDRVLRTELGVADGLADPNVWILDPCCGTGTYLVEVLHRIERTLRERGGDALVAQDLKRAATSRVAGFEIMPAPFVIAHWQVGSSLRRAGAPLAEATGERAAVYLTNALTGWVAPAGPVPHLPFPEFEAERKAAAQVKREAPILVVLGNPPYNAFAGTSPDDEGGLVEPYKEGLVRTWGIRKFNLDDLYVRFFRVAERRIAERTRRGIVCFISNHSYVWYPSFLVMRERFVREFDRIWIDNMNGSKYETGKLTPDGRPDPSVFSTEQTRVGIQVGTAIGLFARRGPRDGEPAAVGYRDFWGETKRVDLLASLDNADFDARYAAIDPRPENRFSFRPETVPMGYRAWPRVTDLAAVPPFNGLLEARGGALIDADRVALERRMRIYFDPASDWEAVRAAVPGLTARAARFNPETARHKAVEHERFDGRRLVRYFLRPFDPVWAYTTTVRPIWNEPRPALLRVLSQSGGFLATRPAGVAQPEGLPLTWIAVLGDYDALRGHAHYTPVFENLSGAPRPNLSAAARTWLSGLGLPDPDADAAVAALPWLHALAIGYSPAWLSENADGIRQDWPRVPLPGSADLLRESAALGRQVADLLDPDIPVEGVTAGAIRPELAAVAVLNKRGGGQATADELKVTAGWGHAGRKAAVMPGRGRTETRAYAQDEGETAAHAGLLGDRTLNVFLNGEVFWRNVPAAVWNFTIGGYQVLKKWLSYRERELLDRPLTVEEARHVTATARRLAALRLLGPALDANYQACAAAHIPFNAPVAGNAPNGVPRRPSGS